MNFKKLSNITGWVVFTIATIVYFFSAERTGSLWDCGEFITGAYKLEVVHPPGAALFVLIGRMFTLIAEILSDNPEDISFSVNMLSGICSAFAATFVAWTTIMLGKLTLIGRDDTPDNSQAIALAGAGLVAGLSTAFCSSIWFSAVEGEVYAMSTFFTALTLWSTVKWYCLPDTPKSDRWLVFTVYAAGLSIGVHLLSLLTFPALALFYYFKKYENPNLKGMTLATIGGLAAVAFIQKFIIVGIPTLWSWLEVTMVNGFGAPFHSGIFPLILIIGGLIFFGLKYAHKRNNPLAQMLLVCTTLVVIAFSTIGVVVIRANANTPINMNNPSDPIRLIPYLNREQYGERALLKGPHFDADPIGTNSTDRYGRVGDKYEIVDRKVSYKFDPKDEILFPRIGHYEMGRPAQHRLWMGLKSDAKLPVGRPNQLDNMKFLVRYQIGWMYVRYFMWNFAGRQNGIQGFYPWDVKRGNWISGIDFIDEMRLHSTDNMPSAMKEDQGRNKYYMLPFLFGFLGLFYHASRRKNDFVALLALFLITGIGIIIYSNQPPNEPRERDYVLVGSFFTFCIWIGMGVVALYNILSDKVDRKMAAMGATALVLIAPMLMGFQNFDDHSRKDHSGSRDYASNFLNTCEPNAIIFTYGDNDTYPLWYAQEVEGIRRDVRVVNLSLIAVDWYIEQLRRKVNDSPALKMTLQPEQIRGRKRVQVQVDTRNEREMNLQAALKFVNEDHPVGPLDSYFPAKNLYIPVDRQKAVQMGMVSPQDTTVVDKMTFTLGNKNTLIKGDVAVLDIIANNIWERPIYFAVTCRQESLLGLGSYTQLEGLGLRVVPVRSKGERDIYGMIGNGRVNTDALYQNVMEDFRWGNFDKERLFVDRSYLPSVQSHRLAILRACGDLLKKGDKTKAVDLAEKFFESFPNMNFKYDAQIIPMIRIFVAAGDAEKAKKHMAILANETEEHLKFYNSLPIDELQMGFESDYAFALRTKDDLMRMARQLKDQALEEEYKSRFDPYDVRQLRDRDK